MVAFSEMLVPKTKVTKQSKHLVTRGCRVQGKKVEKQEKKEMMIHDAIRRERCWVCRFIPRHSFQS